MQLNNDFEEEQSPDAFLKERKQLRNEQLEPFEYAKQKLRNSIKIKSRKRIRMQLNNDFEEEQSPDAFLKERKQLKNQQLELIEEEVSSESESSDENDKKPTKPQQGRS